MTKKSRRARRQAIKVAQPVRITGPSQRQATPGEVQEVDLRKEYHYVVEDLKRIAVTAVGLLVLLIVLAFLVA